MPILPSTLRGFSTLEILLALTIMMTTLSAIVLLELGLPRALVDGSMEIAATRAASNLMESAFERGFSHFADVEPIASTTTSGITVSLTTDLLPDGFTKRLTSTAAWKDDTGNSRSITLHSLITDFANATKSYCSDVLAGDWTRPQEHMFKVAPGSKLAGGSSTSTPISSLAVSSSTLIAGIGTTTAKSDPTLYIFDISSTTDPVYLGSIDNATSTTRGLSGVVISGVYAFIANAGEPNFATCKTGPACSQLQVFDISKPSSPVNIKNFQIATASPPFASGNNGQSSGRSIAYANGYLYLGLMKTGTANGEELNVVDVHDPRTPEWKGGFSVQRSINRITIQGQYAYLATDDPTRELIMLDVHDPANITFVGSYDAPGISTFGYGNDLALENDTLALGRTYTPNGPELSILSLASSSLQLLFSDSIATFLDPTNVQAVLIRDFLLFVLTNSSLETLDIRDPAHPIPYADPIALPEGSTGSTLACRGNTLYVGSIGTDQTGYLTAITGS